MSKPFLLLSLSLVSWSALVAPASSQVPATLQQQAEAAYARGDAARSIFLYSQLLQQQPDNYQFQFRLAFAMLNAGPEFLQKSYVGFQRAKDINPNVDEPWLYLARIDEALERPAQALGNYQRAFQLNPNNQQAFAGIRRVQAQPALTNLPDAFDVLEQRPITDYIAGVEVNSQAVQGLRGQQAIAQALSWRGLLPGVNINFSTSNYRNQSQRPISPIFTEQPGRVILAPESSQGDSNNFTVNFNWSTADIFLSENRLRLRAYEDDIANTLDNLRLEAQRLFILRSNLLEEFRQLAWQATLNPSDRTIRYNRRDRYLQIIYLSQQLQAITGLY